jgi:hypothetical protein
MQTNPSRQVFIPSGSTYAALAPINHSAAAARPLLRAAFYGRSNSPYLSRASQAIARQFHIRRLACAGHAELVRYFYDIPKATDRTELHRTPPFLHWPSEYHGGWQDLVETLPEEERDFDAVVCLSLDRISCRVSEVKESGEHLARHQVPLISAEGGWQEISPFLRELASRSTSRPDPGTSGHRPNPSSLRSPRDRR